MTSMDGASTDHGARRSIDAHVRQSMFNYHEKLAGAEEKHKPNVYVSMMVAHPRPFCIGWFCFYFLGILVSTIVLNIAGLKAITSDKISNVALNVPSDTYFKREQAFYRTQNLADYYDNLDVCERGSINSSISLIMHHANDGNLLTQKGLTKMESVINEIMSKDEVSDYCYLQYSTCSSSNPYQKYKTSPGCCVNAYTNIATSGSSDSTYNATTAEGCLLPSSPVGYFQKYGDPTFSDISGTLTTIKATSDTDYANLVAMLGKEYDIDNPKTSFAQITVYFGEPLHAPNVTCDTDCEIKEHTKVTDWIDATYSSYLEKLFEASPYQFYFYYSDYDPVTALVSSDLALVVIGIILLAIYMLFVLGSLFLTSCAIFQSIMAYLGGNLIYRYLWPTNSGIGYEDNLGLFCALSIFIILGIGADDVFVFTDKWRENGEKKYVDIAQRFSHTYTQAGKAMLVTSLTTVICFFSNINSSFYDIAAFGTFTGLAVSVNYLMVMTFFPSCVIFYHLFLKDWRCGFCKTQNTVQDEKPLLENESALRSCATKLREFDLAVFFKDTYVPLLSKYRYVVLGFFGAIIISFLVCACLVTAVPFYAYTLLPSGLNWYEYVKSFTTDFPASSSPLYAYVVFGINHNDPISWGNDFNEYQFVSGMYGSGTPQWDESFDISSTVVQVQQTDTCMFLAEKSEFTSGISYSNMHIETEYGVNPQLQPGSSVDSTSGEFGVQCFMDAISQWENVSRWDAAKNMFQAPAPECDVETAGCCRNCFMNFSTDVAPSNGNAFTWDNYPSIIYNTSTVRPSCNCMGTFPIPPQYCLSEMDYVDADSNFKCISQYPSNFLNDAATFLNNDVNPSNYDWWKKYVWATSNSNGYFERVVMNYIKIETTVTSNEGDFEMGMKMVRAWDDWVDKYNNYVKDHGGQKAMIYIPTATTWRVTELLAPSAIDNTILSVVLAFLVLLFFTENWIVAGLAISTVSSIVIIIFGMLYVTGWNLGILEGICCVLIVGFSVDFTIHLADSYLESEEETQYEKVREAISTTGISIISGSISTLLATFPMLFATITFFQKFGIFMFITMFLSTIFSLGFMAVLLMMFGPVGDQGKLSNYYGPFIVAAYEKLQEDHEGTKNKDESISSIEMQNSDGV